MGGVYRYQQQPSGNQSSPVRMSRQGWGHWGPTETGEGWWQRPSHRRRLLPSARTGNKCCSVASAPHQTLEATGNCLPGSAAVQTCVLGAPPPHPGWDFFSVLLFCASSPAFEVVAYRVGAASSKQARSRRGLCSTDLGLPAGITC